MNYDTYISNLVKLQKRKKGEHMGEVVKFGDLITFSAGTNLTRLSTEISDNCIYTLEDFDNDLSSLSEAYNKSKVNIAKTKSVISNVGDVVISMTRNQAGIVSNENSGKYLNSNFVKCQFDKEKLYPWYFCYLFNESITISQQIKKMQQGTIGCINRLTISMIGTLKFNLEDLSQQKMTGDLYRNLLLKERLVQKQMDNMKKYTLEIIRKADNN